MRIETKPILAWGSTVVVLGACCAGLLRAGFYTAGLAATAVVATAIVIKLLLAITEADRVFTYITGCVASTVGGTLFAGLVGVVLSLMKMGDKSDMSCAPFAPIAAFVFLILVGSAVAAFFTALWIYAHRQMR